MSTNYSLEGPVWSSSTITWSFASINLSSDLAANLPFSSYVTQAQYQAVVTLAFNTWAQVANVHFVQVGDSASSDLRIGWSDLISTGDIGEADYHYVSSPRASFSPDVLVRLEDPAETSLLGSGPTGYRYSGYSTQLFQVVLHEIGHGLGLGHSTDVNAVMYPTAQTTNQKLDASDVAAIQAIYGAPPLASASVVGANGVTVYVDYGSNSVSGRAQALLAGITAAVTSGGTLAKSSASALPLGRASALFVASGGSVSLPQSYVAAVDTASSSVTISGSGAQGQSIVAGDGGLVFAALGSGSVVAGDGANQVFVVGSAGPWDVALGNGRNTVLATSGNDRVSAGSGANLIYLGAGATSVTSQGADTIVGGAGTSTITATGTGLAFGGSGGLVFAAMAGTSTVVGFAGSVTVNGGSGGVFFGGAAGNNHIDVGPGPATVVASGNGDVTTARNGAPELIAGGAGAETLDGATSGGANTYFAGTGPDLILGGNGTTAIMAGTGNSTLVAGTGTTLFVFQNGRDGGTDLVLGFKPGQDYVTFQGYGTAGADAVAHARPVGNGAVVSLPDGTQITFAGVTDLSGRIA